MKLDEQRAERLVKEITDSPDSPQGGVLMNDLLSEFHRGYELGNLRPFLRSPNTRLVTIGAWIASELGEKGRPLLGDILNLLTHPEKKVRFSAIDCILLWAEPSDRIGIVSAIKLLDDREAGVRWKAIDFLSRASKEQLQGALSYLAASQPESPYVSGLKWLISPAARNAQQITAVLESGPAELRKYAVAAAARISEEDSAPLLYATSIPDSDIKDFAESRISML